MIKSRKHVKFSIRNINASPNASVSLRVMNEGASDFGFLQMRWVIRTDFSPHILLHKMQGFEMTAAKGDEGDGKGHPSFRLKGEICKKLR